MRGDRVILVSSFFFYMVGSGSKCAGIVNL